MRVIVTFRLRTSVDHRPTAPRTSGNKGKCTHAYSRVRCRAGGGIDHSANVAICFERRRAAGERREECKDEEGAGRRSACDARAVEEVRRGVEGSEGLEQD